MSEQREYPHLFVSDIHGEQEQLQFVLETAARFASEAQGSDCAVSDLPLHFVGDIFDRGPSPDLVVEELMKHPLIDIQWGNHDILWMGAAAGQRGCIANVVRICARYGNLDILEDSYDIDLSALRDFAARVYKDDPCAGFALKGGAQLPEEERVLQSKIQKAMAFIQFKVEAQTIAKHPEYELEDRNLIHHIKPELGLVHIEGADYELTDTVFPTVDWENPYEMTVEEESVMQALEQAFLGCEKLQKHIQFFLDKGALYTVCENNLLFHACVPLNSDGSLKESKLLGQPLKGKALYDAIDVSVRAAFAEADQEKRTQGMDLLWYLWLGEGSPLFAKNKMATFELYLCSDKNIRKETKNAFYKLYEDEAVIKGIFEDFEMDANASRIICGHTPVKIKDGKSPLKCSGKVMVIDGGMSCAYQGTTGIAGISVLLGEGVNALLMHKAVGQASGATIAEATENVLSL